MTKPLDTHLSQREMPARTRRPRTWLVALLGFGAADLLVLNLWAVPKLITSTTTTDMRAAHSGEAQLAIARGDLQPQAAVAAQPVDPKEPAAAALQPEHAVAAPEDEARPGHGANAANAAEHEEPGAQRAALAVNEHAAHQVDSASGQVAATAHRSDPASQEARAVQAAPSEEPAAQASPPGAQADVHATPAQQAALAQGSTPEEAAAPPTPTEPVPADEALTAQAPRAAPPPGGAPPQPSEVGDVPDDPTVARAFAIRAAHRAVRIALQGRAAVSGASAFADLTEADQPLTQIFFSMGNYTLGPSGRQLLERKLPLLTQDERPILIVGAADPSGTEQVNEKLSDARAQSVAEWLLAHGVDAQRIQTHAIGHEGAFGSTLDRRVDIWLGGSR